MSGKEKLKIIFPYIILLLAAMLVFWRVALFKDSFKWDMVSYYFPMRSFISDCLRSGNLPLWLPYQLCGLPLYGDPQSGAWYPAVWLISFLHGYDIYGASIEFILTIFISGAGFYTLAKGMNISSHVSLLVSVCYMSCGFFISNAQHLTLLISAAYLPFVIHFFLRLLDKPNWKSALSAAFFLFLMFTGGYPAHFIICFYLLLIFFLVQITRNLIRKQSEQIRNNILFNSILVFTFVLLSSVAIVSDFQGMSSVTRGEPLTLKEASVFAFTPQCALSFIAPFALQRRIEFFNTDISMSNGYFGIFCLLFLLYFFFIPKSKQQILFLLLAVFFLLASLGESTPVRAWLYHYVPMMNYFRYPSIFRIFSILFFLLLAGFAIDYFFTRIKEVKKIILVFTTLFIFFLAVLILISISRNYSGVSIMDAFRDWKFFLQHSTIYDHLIFQSGVSMILLLLFLALFFIRKVEKFLPYVMIALVFTDMFMAAQLNMEFTVITEGLSPKSVSEKINKLPHEFPVPDSKPIAEHNIFGAELSPLWQNLNVFGKQVHHEGYGPFLLSDYETLLNSSLGQKVFQNKFCFFADSVLPKSALTASAVPAQGNVYLNEKVFADYADYGKHFQDNGTAEVKQLSPNQIIIETETETKRLLVVMQNNFKGWIATANGANTPVLTVNYSLMAVAVPEGKSNVELSFKPPYIHLAAIVSGITLLVVLCLILFKPVKS